MCQSSYNFSSSGNLYIRLLLCIYSTDIGHSFTGYFLVNVFVVLPICASILYLGLQQLKVHAKISHSDVFTYHVATIQIIGTLASFISVLGIAFCIETLVFTGMCMFFISSLSFVLFQCLTCGERYIAVVHPLTYLRLKKRILARNIICGLVWVNCIIQGFCSGFINVTLQDFINIYLGLALVLAYILFCNISVLLVLLRPRPGDGASKNQSTKRAFYTISTILGTLVLKGLADIMGSIIIIKEEHSTELQCGLWLSAAWLSLPSNLILQILYLHRAGKLLCCKRAQTNGTD